MDSQPKQRNKAVQVDGALDNRSVSKANHCSLQIRLNTEFAGNSRHGILLKLM